MRHGVRELPGHEGRRRHRMLPGGDGATLVVRRHPRPISLMAGHCPGLPRLWIMVDAITTWMPGSAEKSAQFDRFAEHVGELVSVLEMARHHQRPAERGSSQRQLRVGELVRHALADMLTRGEVHDPVLEGHLITVPEVEMTADLRLATIYVMPLGGRDTDAVLAAFERNKRYLRGEIARHVNLKFAPEIRFRIDQRFEEVDRIDKLLRTPAVRRDLDAKNLGAKNLDTKNLDTKNPNDKTEEDS